jgi:hypothetical protein
MVHEVSRTIHAQAVETRSVDAAFGCTAQPNAWITCTRSVLLVALLAGLIWARDTTQTAQADSVVGDPPPRIRAISIVGNRQTDEDVVHMLLELDTGQLYDSVAIARAEERLHRVQAFVKVKILTADKGREGKHLYEIGRASCRERV